MRSMRLGDARIRTLRAAALVCGAAALVVSALFLGPVSGASDKNKEAPLDEAELERAQLLFRHYCMDCHGPRLTGCHSAFETIPRQARPALDLEQRL